MRPAVARCFDQRRQIVRPVDIETTESTQTPLDAVNYQTASLFDKAMYSEVCQAFKDGSDTAGSGGGGGERRGDPQHDRRVTVVAALVRDSIVHGSIRQIRGLVNRQGVEITPQGDRGCVSFVKIREDSGLGTDPRRVAQLAQPSHHHFLRPAFLETEFGVLVDIVPNLPKLGE